MTVARVVARTGIPWNTVLDMTPTQINAVLEQVDARSAESLNDAIMAAFAPWSPEAKEAAIALVKAREEGRP